MNLSNITTAYTITDGAEIVSGGYPLSRTWDTQEAAAAAMKEMCWHPKRHAGPFRVETVKVETTQWGTVLSVTRG